MENKDKTITKRREKKDIGNQIIAAQLRSERLKKIRAEEGRRKKLRPKPQKKPGSFDFQVKKAELDADKLKKKALKAATSISLKKFGKIEKKLNKPLPAIERDLKKLRRKKEFLEKQLNKVSKESVRITRHKKNLRRSLKKIGEKSKENQIEKEVEVKPKKI